MTSFYDPFEQEETGSTYAKTPAANSTLTLLYGAENGDFDTVANELATYGPGYVAHKRAQEAREDDLALLKQAAVGLAAEGNVPATTQAFDEIMKYEVSPQPSFIDDVTVSARQKIETMAVQLNKTVDETIQLVNAHADGFATRAALEAAITSLEGRSAGAQLAQDVFGLTSVEDWTRLSPVLNEELQRIDPSVSQSLTTAGSAQSFYRVLHSLPVDERGKFVNNITNRLVSTVGEKDARRFFESVLNITEQSPIQEGIIGLLDVAAITAFARGGLKGILKASSAVRAARDIGAEKAVVDDLVRTIADGKGALGVTVAEAVNGAIGFKLIPSALDGMAPKIQQRLQERVKALLDDVDASMGTAGVHTDELLATKHRLETLYSKAANPAIITSNVSADVSKLRLDMQVTYGTRAGGVFETAEDALAYWGKWLRGDVTVVPIAADNAAAVTRLNTTIASLTSQLGKLRKGAGKGELDAFAEGIKLQQPTHLVIDEVLAKLDKGVALDAGLEAFVGKYVTKGMSQVDAYKAVQGAFPTKAVTLLRKLEDAISEKVALEAGPPKPGYVVRQDVEMPVFLDDIGKLSADELTKTALYLGKANPRLATANSIYSPALMASLKRSSVGKKWSTFISDSFDNLGAASTEKVNAALTRTDEIGRDMNPLELARFGVTTDAEQEAYYAFRTMRNILWQVKEKKMQEAFVSRGYQNFFIGFDDAGAFSGPAKKVDGSSLSGRKVFDADERAFVMLTPEMLDKFTRRGVVFLDFAKGQSLAGHKNITKVAANPAKMRAGDVRDVVGRAEGAYSRIYNEDYFVRITQRMKVDDELDDVTFAFRTAENEQDADAYVKGFRQLLALRETRLIQTSDVERALGAFEKDADALAIKLNGGDFDGATIGFSFDHTVDNFFRNVIGVGTDDKSGGRLFWSGRSEDGLKSITMGGESSATLGPLQSLEAEISNAAAFATVGDWRRTAIQRWANEFDDVVSPIDKMGTKDAEDIFFNVVNRPKGYALTGTDEAKRTRQMLAHKDFIVSQLGAKTVDEMTAQHLINYLAGTKIMAFAHVGKLVRKYAVPEFIKSVNSSLMLGMLSFSQLVVQSSGMALAMSISPKHGLPAAFAIRPILASLTSDNKSVWKWFHKNMNVAKLTGTSVDEFSRIALAIRKTGWLDNIGATSTYSNADGSLNTFAKGRRKFSNGQMWFFNKGEEINRVGAFEIARREFKAANPNAVWDTDEALRTITQRADDLTFNMTKVNEARFQQGWFGIPFQFLQHNIRLGTSLAAAAVGKGTLSHSESLTLALGSYLLYGINNNATPDFMEEWLGDQFNHLPASAKQYLTQGVVSGTLASLMEGITGEQFNVALGSRLSSIQWYEDVFNAIHNVFSTGEVSFGALWGPTGSTLTALVELPVALGRFLQKDEWQAADFARTVSGMGATLAASWRGVDKAYWAYHANGRLYNKKGDLVATLSTPEIIVQGLGFASTESVESASVYKTQREYTEGMKRFADTYIHYRQLSLKARLAGDKDGEAENYKSMSAVVSELPFADQRYIMRLVRERTTYDTVLQESLLRWSNQMSSHKNKLQVNNFNGKPEE